MKHLALLCILLVTLGCRADDSDNKTINQLESEIAEKQAAIDRAKIAGGYPEVAPPAVCAHGVLYYVASTYGGGRIYTVAISSTTLQPIRCNEVLHK